MSFSKRSFLIIIAVVSLIIVVGRTTSPSNSVSDRFSSYSSRISSHFRSNSNEINRKIWQTSRNRSSSVDQDLRANVVLWHQHNPRWQYEMLTDEECDRYVERKFVGEPEVVDTFLGLQDNIIRADLFRYLVLLADGGVYSDMDTECLKPIDQWVPEQYKNQTNVVLGVEYDTYGQGRGMAQLDVQLVNWTLMAKKGHGLLRLTVKRAIEALAALAASQNVSLAMIKADFNDVLATAGPVRLTLSTWEYLSEQLNEDFSWLNATGLQEPKLIGDVLLLPVTSFGNGQSHSFSKPKTDEAALVHHQFKGTWKTDGHAFDRMAPQKQGTKVSMTNA